MGDVIPFPRRPRRLTADDKARLAAVLTPDRLREVHADAFPRCELDPVDRPHVLHVNGLPVAPGATVQMTGDGIVVDGVPVDPPTGGCLAPRETP